MQEYRIGFGVGIDRDGNALCPGLVVDALSSADNAAAMAFGGFARWDVQGGWIADNGKLFMERGVQYSVCQSRHAVGEVAIRAWADIVARTLRQDAYLLIRPDGSADVIRPGQPMENR